MGLERIALESELGRKSTNFRARKRSRAHLERADDALQRTLGRRLRGKESTERGSGSDCRSGPWRAIEADRSAGQIETGRVAGSACAPACSAESAPKAGSGPADYSPPARYGCDPTGGRTATGRASPADPAGATGAPGCRAPSSRTAAEARSGCCSSYRIYSATASRSDGAAFSRTSSAAADDRRFGVAGSA